MEMARWLISGVALLATSTVSTLAASASDAPKDCRLKQYASLQVTDYAG